MSGKVKVKRTTIRGKEYLLDERTNILYNEESKEPIGVLNSNGKIIMYDEGGVIERDSKYKGWKYKIEYDPDFTKEEVIEEDNKGRPKEWEYNFDIYWDYMIEKNNDEVDVRDFIPDIELEDEPEGRLVYYSKKRLSAADIVDILSEKITGEDLRKAYKYIHQWKVRPQSIIDRLYDEGVISISDKYLDKKQKKKVEEESKKAAEEPNPIWDMLVAASREREIKTEEAVKKLENVVLTKQEEDIYRTLVKGDEEQPLKNYLTEPRRIVIPEGRGSITFQYPILALYKFYGYSEADFNEDKQKILEYVNREFEKDKKEKEKMIKKDKPDRSDVFGMIRYTPYRADEYQFSYSIPTSRERLEINIDNLQYNNEYSDVMIKVNDGDLRPRKPRGSPSSVAEMVAAIDELTKLEQQIREYTEIVKGLQAAYKANPTPENREDYKKGAILVEKLKKKYVYEMNKREGKGIDNPKLYEKAKQIADEKYDKPSAYKSGFIIKKYKELGGTYSGEKPEKTGIARWFKEEWKDIGNAEYPVYRPTKRVTIETPLTPEEIKPSNLKKQIKLKQEIKGDANLPPFEKKGTGKVIPVGIALDKISPYDEIWNYSNPKKVAEMAEKYLGKDDAKFVFRSSNPKKKYMIYDKTKEKWVFFGEMGYEDFTKHQDEKRRENYLKRTANIKGNWKDNEYSANNLSRNILW